jgi:hypothetical protein
MPSGTWTRATDLCASSRGRPTGVVARFLTLISPMHAHILKTTKAYVAQFLVFNSTRAFFCKMSPPTPSSRKLKGTPSKVSRLEHQSEAIAVHLLLCVLNVQLVRNGMQANWIASEWISDSLQAVLQSRFPSERTFKCHSRMTCSLGTCRIFRRSKLHLLLHRPVMKAATTTQVEHNAMGHIDAEKYAGSCRL